MELYEPNFNSCIKFYYKIYCNWHNLFNLSPDFGYFRLPLFCDHCCTEIFGDMSYFLSINS